MVVDLQRPQVVRQTDGGTEGRTDGRTNGRTDGRMDERTDGRTDWQTEHIRSSLKDVRLHPPRRRLEKEMLLFADNRERSGVMVTELFTFHPPTTESTRPTPWKVRASIPASILNFRFLQFLENVSGDEHSVAKKGSACERESIKTFFYESFPNSSSTMFL